VQEFAEHGSIRLGQQQARAADGKKA
jgi:hypothetical protein